MGAQTVLLVERDAAFRGELASFLSRRGFGVIPVEDPAHTVPTAVRELPSVILVDVGTRIGSGGFVHEHIAHTPHLGMTPVIYMTDDYSADVVDAADRFGAYTTLCKPFELDYLLGVIHGALASEEAA